MITILLGISGSGKTSYAMNRIDENTILINRDNTRKMLFGVEQNQRDYFTRVDLKQCELLVTETLDDVMYNALNKGIDIIVDNTHLELRFIDDILFRFNASFK